MTHLVTGGAGFIGSHLIDRLIERGTRVVCLDDFNDYYAPSLKRRNVQAHLGHPLFTLVEGDIRDEHLVKNLFDKYRFTKVIHLAARVGVRASVRDSYLHEVVNVLGTSTLLFNAQQHAEQFIFASSSSVYGNSAMFPFREEDPIPEDQQLSPYATTKYTAERICGMFRKLPMSVLRFFSVYGPRMRPDMAIYKFVQCLRQDRAIPVFGDGTMGRDYTYIDDIVQGILAALDKPAPFEVFNLGNSSCVSLAELISELERACGKKSRIEHLPLERGDAQRTCADISKARRMLGYNPTTDIRSGLEKFVRWFDNEPTSG